MNGTHQLGTPRDKKSMLRRERAGERGRHDEERTPKIIEIL